MAVDIDPSELRKNRKNIGFSELLRICTRFFGAPRNSGGSHYVFKTPWRGDPRICIQNDKGKAKPYQVTQVADALEKLLSLRNPPENE